MLRAVMVCSPFQHLWVRSVVGSSLWLGHSTINATEIYARVHPTDKLTAISFMAPPTLRKGHFRPPDKLIALLKGGSLWGAQSGNDAAGRHAAPANSP